MPTRIPPEVSWKCLHYSWEFVWKQRFVVNTEIGNISRQFAPHFAYKFWPMCCWYRLKPQRRTSLVGSGKWMAVASGALKTQNSVTTFFNAVFGFAVYSGHTFSNILLVRPSYQTEHYRTMLTDFFYLKLHFMLQQRFRHSNIILEPPLAKCRSYYGHILCSITNPSFSFGLKCKYQVMLKDSVWTKAILF